MERNQLTTSGIRATAGARLCSYTDVSTSDAAPGWIKIWERGNFDEAYVFFKPSEAVKTYEFSLFALLVVKPSEFIRIRFRT